MTDTVRLGLFAIRQFHQAIPAEGHNALFRPFSCDFCLTEGEIYVGVCECAEFFLSQTCGIEHEYGYVCPVRAEVGDVAILYDCLYFLLFYKFGKAFPGPLPE